MKLVHFFSVFTMAVTCVGVVPPAFAESDGWPSWIGRIDEASSVKKSTLPPPTVKLQDPWKEGVPIVLLESGEWSDGWPSWIGRGE
ncbi:MAG: hypothetical protein WCS85_00540 [Candidatus Peribacteraceae bacterium]